MESIPLPSNISVELEDKNEHKGTVTIEPLYPGYGATVGNALRRVLLSSLPGAAIYAFKIRGVEHEFKSIEYVKEDVVDISLNLKRVNLKCFSNEPVKLELSGKGETVLTAGDIAANSDVEIANPEQVIMTLTDKAASIDMTLWVRQGRGYVTVESRPDEELEVNAIAIDSIFTPIVEVGYQVENIRVGNRTDYDKIIMQITSNGAVSIADALKQSAKILEDHFKTVGEIASEQGASSATDTAESEE